MKTEKKELPKEGQSIVEWYNNELALWRAKWDNLDPIIKIQNIPESSKEFDELIETAKQQEDIRNIKSFNEGYKCAIHWMRKILD